MASVRMREPVTEQALEYAYRNDPAVLALRAREDTEWRRPCACRGVVFADPDDPMQGVSEHQRTVTHKVWRAQNDVSRGPSGR